MTLQRNHYEVLGVPRKATTDEIKKKYREMARQFHPDVAKDKTTAQKVFAQINQAYRVLADPDRRAQYDAEMAADAVARPATSGNGTQPAAPAASQPLTPQQAANVARLLGEAESAMLQNNIGKVRVICDRILETDPRNQKVLGLLGDALAQMGKLQEAANAYHKALQIAPSFALQAKLSRLTGASGGAPPTRTPPPPPPPSNGAAPSNGSAHRTGQNRTDQGRPTTDQGRADKPAGGFLGRLLGRK